MYIVRVSSLLLLTPLQAVREGVLGVVLLSVHYFPQYYMGEGYRPLSLRSVTPLSFSPLGDSRPPAPVLLTLPQHLMGSKELHHRRNDSPWSCFHNLSCCALITPTLKCICEDTDVFNKLLLFEQFGYVQLLRSIKMVWGVKGKASSVLVKSSKRFPFLDNGFQEELQVKRTVYLQTNYYIADSPLPIGILSIRVSRGQLFDKTHIHYGKSILMRSVVGIRISLFDIYWKKQMLYWPRTENKTTCHPHVTSTW